MKIKLLAFGIARDILGAGQTHTELPEGSTIGDLRSKLYTDFPAFAKLASLAIARNNEYTGDTDLISATDEIVLIPPVSGG
ncbi:MAG: MoaD/ThiS family protein [Saprospiraceae bacterium]|nr:MoaD/ThiS family protein [Saprospiraceae bacterium]